MLTYVDFCANPIPASTPGYVNEFSVSDEVKNGTPQSLAFNEGVVSLGPDAVSEVESKDNLLFDAYPIAERRYGVVAGGVKNVDLTEVIEAFAEENDYPDTPDDPILLLRADSFRLPVGIDVTMAYLPLPDSMMFALIDGVIKVTVDSGEEVELRRHCKRPSEDIKWAPSCSVDDFEGVPAGDLYDESFLIFTVRRKVTFSKIKQARAQNTEYMNMTSSFQIHYGYSMVLDSGRKHEEEQDALAAQRAAEEAEAARREEVRQRHAAELAEMESRRKESDAKKSGRSGGGRRTGAAGAKPEAEESQPKGTYSKSAADFLTALGLN